MTLYLSDLFDTSDLDIQDGHLSINSFLCSNEEVMYTKFEDDRPKSFGENVRKLIIIL